MYVGSVTLLYGRNSHLPSELCNIARSLPRNAALYAPHAHKRKATILKETICHAALFDAARGFCLAGAQVEFNKALEQDPSDVVSINNYALCLMYQRDLMGATRFLEVRNPLVSCYYVGNCIFMHVFLYR